MKSSALQSTIVADLIQACDWAVELVARGREKFDAEVMTRLAAEAIINRLGTGLGQLSPETLSLAPTLPLAVVRGMRNRVVHEYHRIDYAIVWDSLALGVPELRVHLETLRDSLSTPLASSLPDGTT